MAEDPLYRKKLLERMGNGKAAPGIEQMIWFYAYGKPKDTIAIEGRVPIRVVYHADMKPPAMPGYVTASRNTGRPKASRILKERARASAQSLE